MIEGVKRISDIAYARASDKELFLDLYLPEKGEEPWPVILWVHGGAWRTGDKGHFGHWAEFARRGYAVASINYRLSQEAIFPAQIHDCKAAVRWLRANAGRYRLDAEHIGAWGASAGGHLVALLGTSGSVAELEGELGHPGYSSRVQAVCDWFGPSDFLRMNDIPGRMDHDAPDSPESQLVGGPIQENKDKVARANPITYIRGDEPPFLIMHGSEDLTVLPHQSELLYEALCEAGVEATLHILEGAGHGGEAFHAPEAMAIIRAFFDKHLKRESH